MLKQTEIKRRLEIKMYKKRVIAIVILIVCLMTGCAQKPNSEERNGVSVATGSGASNDNQVNVSIIPNNETNVDEPAKSVENENSEILATCAGMKIVQTIDAAEGTTLLINADVNVDGIAGVSQYEYVLEDITEDVRTNLFNTVFYEQAEKAEYDELNDVWTLEIDPATRNYFLYQISYSNGGPTIPGEQIIMLENRYYDLYPFEDNRLDSVSTSTVSIPLDEVTNRCGQVVDSITGTGDYVVNYVHAYGKNGRRPYYRVIFKRMLDGMPVTAYNNLSLLFDNEGIEKVTGSLFSAKEIGLEKAILLPDEAIGKLREQTAFLNFKEESRMTVTEITLEYVVTISPDGKALITPVWRFWIGENEDERNFLCQKILAVDAVTGELIWEERGHTM